MVYFLLFLFILPIIILIISNGRNGKGYNIQIELPPKGSPWRTPARIGMLAYACIGLLVVIFTRIEEGQSAGHNPNYIAFSTVFFVLVVSAVVLITAKRYKK